MIYHIPVGTTIWRMKSSDEAFIGAGDIVTDKPVWYAEDELVKRENHLLPASGVNVPTCVFLLPLNAKPYWCFRVYEVDVKVIPNVGKGDEREILRDLRAGNIDPFKVTPESKVESPATAEEEIVGRPLTPRERTALKEQWDNEEDEDRLNFNVKLDKKKFTTSMRNSTGDPNWMKNVPHWLKPVARPMFPKMPQDLLDKFKIDNRPKDVVEAMAWEIDKEITKDLINGLWGLVPKSTPGNIFYMDYVFGSKKKS